MKKSRVRQDNSRVSASERQTERSLLDCLVSCYIGIDPKDKTGDRPLGEVLELIKTQAVPEQDRIRKLKVQRLKNPSDEKIKNQHQNAKKNLFGFTPSGICPNGRSDKQLEQYNGLVLADFDNLAPQEHERILDLLRKDRHVFAVWTSVSGDGVKALIACEPAIEKHRASFATAVAYYKTLTGHEIDPKCKNEARFCFGGHDPDLFINRKVVRLAAKEEKKERPDVTEVIADIEGDLLNKLRRTIKRNKAVGEVEWTESEGRPIGICHCPDPSRQHPKATIHLSGVPTLYCHHEMCAGEVAVYNQWLRNQWTSLQTGNWAYLVETKMFINLDNLQELDKDSYNGKHKHLVSSKITPAELALRNRDFPKYDRPVYLPNQAVSVEKGDGLKLFNLWRAQTEIRPAKGDVTSFTDHVAYLIPFKKEAEIFLDWLAFQIQFPGRKINWAVLLQGAQRIGKSYFMFIMRKLLGDYNVSRPTNDEVHEQWTAWAKHCCLVIIDEFMSRGKEKMELVNRLQPMITQDEVGIREMHKVTYQQPNHFNILMFTNYTDALPLVDDDQRYCVFFSPAERKTDEHYNRLWDWTRAHLPELLHWFLNRDLSKFNPQTRAPDTQWKSTAKIKTNRLAEWIQERVELLQWPFHGDIVGATHLEGCLSHRLGRTTSKAIAEALKLIGAKRVGNPTMGISLSSGGFAHCWAVRNQDLWAEKSDEEIRAEYERWSTKTEPGGDPNNPIMDAKPM